MYMDEDAEMALNTLESLMEHKRSEIKRNQGHIESLEDENEMLGGQVKALEEATEQVREAYGKNDIPDSQTPALIGKYAKSTLTEAILDVVTIHGLHPGMLVPEIMEKLKSEGFKSEAKKPYASVYALAQSLAERGKIREGKKDGKRSFMRKNP